ncbi:hypothetical protein [Methylobacterium fujisawaense]|uniref:hypothetical protein n=1 Tax=Methylobacterium fujisawaense TaxID=107400 RepID=UPI0036FB8C40
MIRRLFIALAASSLLAVPALGLDTSKSPSGVFKSLEIGAQRLNGTQSLAVDPIDNPAGINQSSSYGEAYSAFENKMEMMHLWNCYATKGGTHTHPPDSYFVSKVCGTFAMKQRVGSGPAYAFNTILGIDPGVGAHDSIGLEVDVNNNNMDYGVRGPGGESGAVGAGIYVSGNGSKALGSGLLINLAQGQFKLRRGISIYNGTVATNTYEDLTNSGGSGIYLGGTKIFGIDMGAMIARSAALHFASAHSIAWRNNANTADLNLIGKDTSDQLMLGYGKTTRIQAAADTNLLMRGPVSLAGGSSITSANDANSALKQLEIVASTVQISSPLTTAGAVTAPAYNTSTAAGVSCAAGTVSLSTLVVTNGIITHC